MTTSDRQQGRKTASWWDSFWRRPQAARDRSLTCRRTVEETLDLLAPELGRLGECGPGRPRLRVLDLGCGNGDLSIGFLADPRIALVGLDISAEALAQFRQQVGDRFAGRLCLVRADVYSLPFAGAAFDAVVSFGYASAASYPSVEREVVRVLRPGGVAVVDFANPSLYHWLAAWPATLRWYRRFRDPRSDQYHFGRRGVAGHFQTAGLVLVAVRYLNAYPPLGVSIPLPWRAAVDRCLARVLGPLLGRVLLVKLRRSAPTTRGRPRSRSAGMPSG